MIKYHSKTSLHDPNFIFYFSGIQIHHKPGLLTPLEALFFSSSGLQILWLSLLRKFSFLSICSSPTGLERPNPSYLSSRIFPDSVSSYLCPCSTIPKHLAIFFIITYNLIVLQCVTCAWLISSTLVRTPKAGQFTPPLLHSQSSAKDWALTEIFDFFPNIPNFSSEKSISVSLLVAQVIQFALCDSPLKFLFRGFLPTLPPF